MNTRLVIDIYEPLTGFNPQEYDTKFAKNQK